MSETGQISRFKMLKQIKLILDPEFSFYMTAVIYSAGVGILTLAVPISVQSLVNTVTFGVLIQPLIVLSIVLLVLLSLSGLFYAFQTYAIELFQRHFYGRISSDIAIKLLNADYKKLKEENSVGLVNRYFDVMTVQKSVATLLTGGVAIVLQTGAGLLLLAFYHPYFLVFDFILIFSIYLVWKVFSKEALRTAVRESKSKYAVADWMEELARINLFFKSENRKAVALKKSDDLICSYLENRRIHFKQVFWQTVLLLFIYALMSSLILGLGGFLVIEGQLSLGQLVAAELVVTVILAGFSKSGKYLESFYDLYAAVDKLSYFYDIKSEPIPQSIKHADEEKLDLVFSNTHVVTERHEYVFDYNFKFDQNYYVYSKYHSSKSVMIDLLRGLIAPTKGFISLGGEDITQISPFQLRKLIYVVDVPQYFSGTIRENLMIDNPDASHNILQQALELTELDHIHDVYHDQLDSEILPSGYPLWSSQLIRFEVARALIAKPKILVLTESFDQIEEKRRCRIIDHLKKENMTVIYFTKKDDLEGRFHHHLILDRNQIHECKDYSNLKDILEHE